MRLSDFILDNREPILQAWENFARTVETPNPTMDARGLRNHAEYILRAVALDLRTSQSEQQQIEKSHGLGPKIKEETAAQRHAFTRLLAGFSMDQLVSEYRALRSSVLRLWLAEGADKSDEQLTDMIRYNEAIDQAMVESIATYGKAVEATRRTVLGVLGHDLRTPLGAVTLGMGLLSQNQGLGDRGKRIISQISKSVQSANQMVNDLLDLAHCNLGTGIPVQPVTTDLTAVCQAVVDEVSLAHPNARIAFFDTSAITGKFDPSRIAQVFSNLIGNAAWHGNIQHPINVTLNSDGHTACFCVQNHGAPIPRGELPSLFNPEARYSKAPGTKSGAYSGLGLGLFIASQIVERHAGTIEVESTVEHGTLFRVRLPIHQQETS